MTSDPLVIVGSGPAGLAAARAFRERDENTPVLMITADRHPAYNRPPLTKDYLRGESERDELWLVEEDWYADHDVELRLATRVSDLDPGRRHVTITDGSKIRYRDLVLATGSRPKPLDVPGGDHPELILVRDLDSGDRLRTLGGQTGTRVVVIGSGFIGCEAAASLATRGLDVTLVHSDDHPHTTRLGAEAGKRIGDWLTEHGVTRRTATRVSALERRARGLAGRARRRLDAHRRRGGLRRRCGTERRAGPASGAAARPRRDCHRADLRTADLHIFAVGDIAYALNSAAGRRLRVEHWGDADRHGTIAGTVAAGGVDRWAEAPGFWSGIGDRTLKYSAWGTATTRPCSPGRTRRGWSGIATARSCAESSRSRTTTRTSGARSCSKPERRSPRQSGQVRFQTGRALEIHLVKGTIVKAVTWQGREKISVDEVPDPQIQQPTDAVIEVTSTAICGSDLHLYSVLGARTSPPATSSATRPWASSARSARR